MPSSTPNQNIPYPLSTDNVNVQQDIQNIAEAVDNVLESFSDTLDENTADINNAISNTIPELIGELGLETLLANGLTWGELKGI
jgi:hypothetical protein